MARRLQLWTTDPGRNHERATEKTIRPTLTRMRVVIIGLII